MVDLCQSGLVDANFLALQHKDVVTIFPRCEISNMEKNKAIKIMECLLRSQHALDEAAEIVENFKDHDELMEFREALATIIGENFGNIMLPIIQQYPELNPYPPKR